MYFRGHVLLGLLALLGLGLANGNEEDLREPTECHTLSTLLICVNSTLEQMCDMEENCDNIRQFASDLYEAVNSLRQSESSNTTET